MSNARAGVDQPLTGHAQRRGGPHLRGDGRIAGLLTAIVVLAGPASAFGQNLLANPGAELGTASAGGYDVVAIPGWTSTGNFTAVQYGTGSSIPATPTGGANFFSGGPANASSSASQTVDVSAAAQPIDNGERAVTLSAELGGFSGQTDGGTVTAVALGAAGQSLGELRIGPPVPADRNSQTGFVVKTASRTVPRGTRSFRVEMTAIRGQGDYNDSYFDNVGLELAVQAPPPPLPAVLCPGAAAPWTGEWEEASRLDGGRSGGTSTVRLLQTGDSVAGEIIGAEGTSRGTLTVSSKPGVLSHLEGQIDVYRLSVDLVDARTYRGTRQVQGAGPVTVTGTLRGCPAAGPAPNLQSTIPSPTTVSAGPTQATFPGRVSLRSLKRSKCVKVVVRTTRPARVLATIFSGRRSIRLFGQKEVLFLVPGRRVVCIMVPLRAHTFNVRTPLRFALGYRLGTAPPRPGARRPRPVIRPIRLVP
ncbi:MAG: hypothetical protein AB1416_06855 [Actinomycetota bacterium]